MSECTAIVKFDDRPRRLKLSDEALLMQIKNFTAIHSTWQIVDGIRAKGYAASPRRVEHLINRYFPFAVPDDKESDIAKGVLLQFKRRVP